MWDLLLSVGLTGNVVSVLLYGSPIPTFWRIFRRGSAEEFDPLPYITSLLGASLWAYYGVLKPDGLLVVTVNVVGAVLEALYVSLYIFFASPARRLKAGILVAVMDVGFLVLVVGIIRLIVEEDMKLVVLGVICFCLSLLMYGTPLAITKIVVTTRSVEYMPFLLTLFILLNGGIWTIYSVLDKDYFLGIANGIGFILGIIQLILYIIYMNPNIPKCLSAAIEQDSQLHGLLVPHANTHVITGGFNILQEGIIILIWNSVSSNNHQVVLTFSERESLNDNIITVH